MQLFELPWLVSKDDAMRRILELKPKQPMLVVGSFRARVEEVARVLDTDQYGAYLVAFAAGPDSEGKNEPG